MIDRIIFSFLWFTTGAFFGYLWMANAFGLIRF